MMQLRHNPTSPFVRKVMVAAIELGLDGEIERVPADVWSPDSDIGKDNPLLKVPALICDEGTLVDSTLIASYLDTRAGSRLFPPRGEGWRTLQLYQLADGIMEASVACVVETLRRPEELRSEALLGRNMQRIGNALDVIERDYEPDAGGVDIATVTLAVALAYLDFRQPDFDWRTGHPRLSAFYDAFAARPSMQQTVPPT